MEARASRDEVGDEHEGGEETGVRWLGGEGFSSLFSFVRLYRVLEFGEKSNWVRPKARLGYVIIDGV